MTPFDFEYDPEIWQNMVSQIINSDFEYQGIREADHNLLGLNYFTNAPVLMHRPILGHHQWVLGSSGCGKTSKYLMPLILQLLRGCRTASGWSAPQPLIIINMKDGPEVGHCARYMHERVARADAALLEQQAYQLLKTGYKQEAEALEQQAYERLHSFKFFHLNPSFPCHKFNPYMEFSRDGTTTPIALASLLLEAMQCSYGSGYGRGYYSRCAFQLLRAILEHPSRPQSFVEMNHAAEQVFRHNPQQYKDGADVLAILGFLQGYPQLVTNGQQRPEDIIYFPDVLSKSQTVYFHLPATEESTLVAKAVGMLVLYSLFVTARLAQRQKIRFKGTVIIDEAHFICNGSEFANILSVLRSTGLGLVACHQTKSQLNGPDFDARPILESNTQSQIAFDIKDVREQQDMMEASGEENVRIVTETEAYSLAALAEEEGGFSGRPDGQTFTEARSIKSQLEPRVKKNDIHRVNADPLAYWYIATPPSGFGRYDGYVPVRCTWPVTEEVYNEWCDADWFSAQEYGLQNPADEPITPDTPQIDSTALLTNQDDEEDEEEVPDLLKGLREGIKKHGS